MKKINIMDLLSFSKYIFQIFSPLSTTGSILFLNSFRSTSKSKSKFLFGNTMALTAGVLLFAILLFDLSQTNQQPCHQGGFLHDPSWFSYAGKLDIAAT